MPRQVIDPVVAYEFVSPSDTGVLDEVFDYLLDKLVAEFDFEVYNGL